jgi:hypothetical protein
MRHPTFNSPLDDIAPPAGGLRYHTGSYFSTTREDRMQIEERGLAEGDSVTAIIKSTEVELAR